MNRIESIAVKKENNSYPVSASSNDNAPHPWWAVDLGAEYHIYYVLLTNRGDCCRMYLLCNYLPSIKDIPYKPLLKAIKLQRGNKLHHY